jgi:tetratricopeptide (TPR) repeat protein
MKGDEEAYLYLYSWGKAYLDFKRAVKLKKDLADAYYQIGLLYEHDEPNETAREYFLKTLKYNPRHLEACIRIASYYWDMGLNEQAFQYYRQAAALNPADPWQWYYCGYLQLEMEQYAEAVSSFSEIVKLDPMFREGDVFIKRGEAYYYLGYLHLARLDFDTAELIDPENNEVFNYIGNIYSNNHPEVALWYYNRILSTEPDYVETLHNRSEVLQELKRYGEAEADLDKAINVDPDNPCTYGQKGLFLLKMKQYKDAFETLSVAVNGSSYIPYNRARGIASVHLGKYEQVVKDFEYVIKRNEHEDDDVWYYTLGLKQTGSVEKALSVIEEFLPKVEEKNKLYLVRAEILDRKYRTARAKGEPKEKWEACRNQALEDYSNVGNQIALETEDHLQRATLFSEAGIWTEALRDIDWVLLENPDHLNALRLRGVCRAATDPAVAIQDLEIVIQKAPGYYPAYRDLCRVLTQAPTPFQDLNRAVAIGVKAVELSFREPECLEALGKAYLDSGRLAEAQALFEEAKQ